MYLKHEGEFFMKVSRKMTAGAAIAFAMTSLLAGNAASAAPASVGKSNEAVPIENEATALYREMSSDADPKQVYAEFTDEERAVFDGYFLPSSFGSEFVLSRADSSGNPVGPSRTFSSEGAAMKQVAAASGCWVGTSKYTAYAALGNAVWDTWTEGSWCGNGSSATSASTSRTWATIAAVGWRDGGTVAKGAGVAGGEARMWGQHRLVFGTGGWDVQTQQPCNRLNGKGNGVVYQTWSCSIV
ncbi:hypothetical protein [Clavibacter michiganensis]|nr:hypothetical protein [Clavibacter michiganensis]